MDDRDKMDSTKFSFYATIIFKIHFSTNRNLLGGGDRLTWQGFEDIKGVASRFIIFVV